MDRSPTALGDLRVIELADRRTAFCGKFFADMGADVLLIEPPEGAPNRKVGPYLRSAPDAARSVRFAYENAGKRSAAVRLENADDRTHLLRLLEGADLFIEGAKPGALRTHGLDYDSLAAINPRLIMVSITDFGQDGPWAQYEATDLVSMALGGVAFLGGYPDTPPARIGGEQSTNIAGAHAACAALLALYERSVTGHGQHIDESTHQAVAYTQEIAMQGPEYDGVIRGRVNKEENPVEHGVYRCSDGFIICTSIPRNWDGLITWMIGRGVEGADALLGEEWKAPGHLGAHAAEFNALFIPFLASMTRDEACDAAQALELMFAPVYSAGDLIADPQLAATGYFQRRVLWPGQPPVQFPGRAYDLSATPWGGDGPVPIPTPIGALHQVEHVR